MEIGFVCALIGAVVGWALHWSIGGQRYDPVLRTETVDGEIKVLIERSNKSRYWHNCGDGEEAPND